MILVLHFGRWCRRHEPCVVVRVRDVKKFDGIEVELSRGDGEASVGKAYFWLRIRSPRRSVAVNCKHGLLPIRTTDQAIQRDHRVGCRALSDAKLFANRSALFANDEHQGAPRQISLSKLFANSIATFAFISARSAPIRRYFWN